MKLSWLYVLLSPAVLMACKSPPAVEQAPTVEPPVPVVLEVEAEPSSNPISPPISVDQEVYDQTFAEVKLFVDNLNQLIGRKNYEGWKDTLSDDFFSRISSPSFLANASEAAVLKSRKIVLKTPNDYFLNVVVPSRSNSRADEIEFTAADKVKVFYLDKVKNTTTGEIETRRLRLYELIKFEDTWKIID